VVTAAAATAPAHTNRTQSTPQH